MFETLLRTTPPHVFKATLQVHPSSTNPPLLRGLFRSFPPGPSDGVVPKASTWKRVFFLMIVCGRLPEGRVLQFSVSCLDCDLLQATCRRKTFFFCCFVTRSSVSNSRTPPTAGPKRWRKQFFSTGLPIPSLGGQHPKRLQNGTYRENRGLSFHGSNKREGCLFPAYTFRFLVAQDYFFLTFPLVLFFPLRRSLVCLW